MGKALIYTDGQTEGQTQKQTERETDGRTVGQMDVTKLLTNLLGQGPSGY